MSLGNISKLKTDEKNILILSIFDENMTPKIIPDNVARKPIVKPVKKKISLLMYYLNPKFLR